MTRISAEATIVPFGNATAAEPPAASRAAAGTLATRAAAGLRVAYLINQYPKVSHSFIRREILALERQGVTVDRYAARGWDADVVDPADIAERTRTRYLMQDGLLPLLASMIRMACTSPLRFIRALVLAIRTSLRSERSTMHHLTYLLEACRLAEWLRESGATHLHAHFGTNSTDIAMLANALGGPPFSFTNHGADEGERGNYLNLPTKLARAKFAVAISSFTRSQILRRTHPSCWQKVKIVHCGLDAPFLEAPATMPPAEPRLVCVARLSAEKGQTILLQALRRVCDVRPDCKVVLAGDGEMRADLERRITSLGLDDNVSITGWISSRLVSEELQRARALVLPSFQEGLPVVIMEALALRRPVIATYVSGVPELVVSGESGWIVPAGSIDQLAEAMLKCLEATPEQLLRMGEAGCARVRQRHDIDREAAKIRGYIMDKAVPTGEVEEWRP